MLFTITYTGQNTQELGYLLHKNPYRPQSFELNYGHAYVFYPELSNERTTAALLLDIDPIDLARGRIDSGGGGLFDYVNDRPYVSSSFLSTAISKVFGTAIAGRADEHQELSDSCLDLTAGLTMLPCRGSPEMLNRVFEPLGYKVSYEVFDEDENFPVWGKSRYVNLVISGKVRLRDLLKHIYILVPVFDRQKHYWIGGDEVEKLLRIGGDWLSNHPEKEFIAGRYLKHLRPLVNKAFERLVSSDEGSEEGFPDALAAEEIPEKKLRLNTRRLGSVVAALKNSDTKSVIDMGCGNGALISLLLKEKQFAHIAGMDVSHMALEYAREKLGLERAGDSLRERITLFQSSITYKDIRFEGYDAACVTEVVEHLDPPRLTAFEKVLFGYAKPPLVILTTPNREYNIRYENLNESTLRHSDHRFEWTRAGFQQWAKNVAEKYSYTVQFSEVGDSDEALGAPTQMGVFTKCG